MEKTHAELEKYHYSEVRTNPQYAIDGMMDVRREEMEMNMPIIEVSEEPAKIPTLIYEYRDSSQIHGHLTNLDKRVFALEEQLPRKYKPNYKQYINK